jgi:RNA polymerase sigma factor (TIGR02999 family)
MEAPENSRQQVTLLLASWRAGDETAPEKLAPLVYEHLRTLASRQVSREREGHTLSPTALVHEAYLRMAGAEIPYQDRYHFYAVAARTMRRVLVDYARGANRERRGGGAPVIPLDDSIAADGGGGDDIILLNSALEELAAMDANKALATDLVYFGGLTQAEAAEAMGISEQAVYRHLRLARAWLYRRMTGGTGDDS